MREPDYEEKLHAFQELLAKSLGKMESKSDANIVVWGLCRKAWSHTEMALSLIEANASSEAMILLRSAYEAMVRAYYLFENPEKVQYYKAFSELTALRNQLESVAILSEGDVDATDFAAIEEQKSATENQRKKIIQENFHELYQLSEDDLNDLKALQKVTNNRNMPNFEETRRAVKGTPLAKALLTSKFQMYNLGSQMTHSSYGMMMSVSYHNETYPLCSEHSMYSFSFLLLNCACELFHLCGAMSDEQREALRNFCHSFKENMRLD